jgi:hypothetical protein
LYADIDEFEKKPQKQRERSMMSSDLPLEQTVPKDPIIPYILIISE